MKWPSEFLVVWERPISCFGRVIPVAMAPITTALSQDGIEKLSDLSQATWVTTIIAVVVSFWLGISAWLSNGASTARQEIEQRKNGTEVAKS